MIGSEGSDWTPETEAFLGLDPLFKAYALLSVRDVLDLEPVVGCPIELYKLYSHNICRVQISGTLTRIERLQTAFNLTVDDGTGAVDCIYWDEFSDTVEDDADVYTEGTAVTVLGELTTYRETRQIKANIVRPTHPHEQQEHEQRVLQLKEYYKKPFELPNCITKNKEAIMEAIFDKQKTNDSVPQEAAPTKDTLKDALLEAYRAQSQKLKQVMKNQALRDLAKAILEAKNAAGDVQHLLKETHGRLIKAGDIMEVQGQDGYYTAVDDNALQVLILNILNEAVQQLERSNNYDGISANYIVARLMMNPQYADFSCKEKVASLLKKMEEVGDVILVDTDSYKPTISD